MTKVLIHAVLSKKGRSRGFKKLVIKGTQERTNIPCIGGTLILAMPRGVYTFDVVGRVDHWRPDGEDVQLWVEGLPADLIGLALVYTKEWKIIAGLDELTKDQRELYACNIGTCGD